MPFLLSNLFLCHLISAFFSRANCYIDIQETLVKSVCLPTCRDLLGSTMARSVVGPFHFAMYTEVIMLLFAPWAAATTVI